jgi:hypothetical protein
MINQEEFWANAAVEGDCLIWKGTLNPKPLYGVFQMAGGRLIAHRVAYELTHGNIPKGAHITRTCQNPLCIKSEHLRLANSLKSTVPVEDLKARIQSCVKVVDDCWVWQGEKPKSLSLPTGMRLLVRGIYELFKSPLRKSQEVTRSCKNEECHNPEHLIALERADLGLVNAKLTKPDVDAIRAAVVAGPVNIGEMAKQYNTSRQTIHAVVYNHSWYDAEYHPPEKIERLPNRSKESIDERFWKKVDKSGECWEWTAYNHNGFGHFSVDHSPKLAHRVAYGLAYGDIPEGKRVLHTCDNDLCVRPEHLYLDEKRIAAK